MPFMNGTSAQLPYAVPTMRIPSVMRAFLEEPTSFTWPSDSRKVGLCYQFDANYPVGKLLVWERSLTAFKAETHSESSCCIDQWRVIKTQEDNLQFKECFAVKQLRKSVQDDSLSNNEVQAMTDLRFPHVAALLGTYTEYDRLHILTFPAGCCDLGDLLDCMSLALKGKKWVRPQGMLAEYAWPFEESLETQQTRLKGYFICLCEALAYLHRSHIRHKDIKPENIIIDKSGRVVLMDFGISTKFPTKDPSLSTQNPKTPSTSRYRPPEMQDGDKRDGRSDVWSLGCVFLEMVTLILGKDIDSCKQHCSHRERKVTNTDFCANLEGIRTWLIILEGIAAAFPRHCDELKNILSTIKEMLRTSKEDRPYADGLWKNFDFPDLPQCSDCHPSNPHRWEPTTEQRLKSEAGAERRQKMQAQEILKVVDQRNRELEEAIQRITNGTVSVRRSIDRMDRTRSRSPPIQGEEIMKAIDRRPKELDEAMQRIAHKTANAGQTIEGTHRRRSVSPPVQGPLIAVESSDELPSSDPLRRRSRTSSQTSLPARRSILKGASDEPPHLELHPPRPSSYTVTGNRTRGILTTRRQEQSSNLSSPPSPTPSNLSSMHATKTLRFQRMSHDIVEGEGEGESEGYPPGWNMVDFRNDSSAAIPERSAHDADAERPQSPRTPHIMEPSSLPDDDQALQDCEAQDAAEVNRISRQIDKTRLSPNTAPRIISTDADRTRNVIMDDLPGIETICMQDEPAINDHVSHRQQPRTRPTSPCQVHDRQKVAACNCHDLKSGLTQVEYKFLRGMDYVCFKIPHVDQVDVHSTTGFMASIDTSLHEDGFWGSVRNFFRSGTARTIYMYNYDEERRPVKLIDHLERKSFFPETS